MTLCSKCRGTGVIDTGNGDFPCSCLAGDTALFNVANAPAPISGATLKRKIRDVDNFFVDSLGHVPGSVITAMREELKAKAASPKKGDLDANGFYNSPVFCDHANEVPLGCQCPPICYCKAPGNTCGPKPDRQEAGVARIYYNAKAEIQVVLHSQLEPTGDSPFRVKCPVCKKGTLLVARDGDNGFKLSEFDCCILCGQRFRYADIKLLRQRAGEG